ncbi:hypothetical protein D9758_005894 [Tetrapyrgos nigripes]|uniref:AAA+ ATPase domain-containing protein n=1 Tax=Tetrapyrgos nigripes TaxID=182062 RepID=A0A8H5G2V4_9AGAR|nr:hypothetical protein D9758_005894 [Tetrapyrgos nigripes]
MSHKDLQPNGSLTPSTNILPNGDPCPPGGPSSELQPNGHVASTDEPSSSIIPTRRRGDDYQSILKLDVKRIQLRWDDGVGEYVARDEEPRQKLPKDGEPSALSIVRRFLPTQRPGFHNVVEEVHLHSPAIIESVKVVMKGNRSINWRADPVKFDPNDLLAHMPFLKDHLRLLLATPEPWDEELEERIDHLEFLIEFLDKEYRDRLQELESLKAAGQVTFSWIWGIFLPGSILFTRCPVTGVPCAVRLVSIEVVEPELNNPRHYALTCDYVNVQSRRPGLSTELIKIVQFNGAKRIRDLNAYPFELVTDRDAQQTYLTQRGRRHWQLVRENWRHMRYDAVAYRWDDRLEKYRKVKVKSRFVIDQEMYDMHCVGRWSPGHNCDLDGGEVSDESRTVLTDEEYLIFSARLYGYSLSDRRWLEFQVAEAKEISWNPDIFNSLELSQQTKHMVRALIESQGREDIKFDDFVQGKGQGLILNLSGPPGVGKTLTAEATAEVTRSPLYMIGAGDLGTIADELDRAFSKISTLAERWKAVVLIDEADVFLEKRENQDIKRNAMVAVFLRHLEYWLGILFLTTNRVQVFDEAMMSRIHVSLTYDRLSIDAKERLWSAFLTKAEFPGSLTAEQFKFLKNLPLNGREIKNVVKVATTLAAHQRRSLAYEDVMQALRVLNGTQQNGASSSSQRIVWISSNRKLLFPLTVSALAFIVVRYFSLQ